MWSIPMIYVVGINDLCMGYLRLKTVGTTVGASHTTVSTPAGAFPCQHQI